MRIISPSTVRAFAAKHANATVACDYWLAETAAASWANMPDVKRTFRATDQISAEIAVFDLGGNHGRLIGSIWFGGGIVFVKGVYTHPEYDRLDVQQFVRVGKERIRRSTMRRIRNRGARPAGYIITEAAYLATIDHLEDLCADIEVDPDNVSARAKMEALWMDVDAYQRLDSLGKSDQMGDVVDFVKHRMEYLGLVRADIQPAIGTRSRVAEILGRKRPLTLRMIHALAPVLHVPPGALVDAMGVANPLPPPPHHPVQAPHR